jgi:hypothetical protein
VVTWMDERPYMVSFIASVMRNGTLEKEYLKMMNGPSEGDLVKCGGRVFSDSTTKWRGLRLSAAPRLLASTLERPSMEEWWKGTTGFR